MWVALVVALLPALAASPGADTAEVLRYALGEGGLAKYVQATKSLAALPEGVPGACDDDDDDDAPASIDAMAARLDAVPGAAAALRSAGMTPREYVLFGWSVFQNGMAAWALDQPGGKLPPGVSRANVEFCRAHAAELDALGALSRSRCDGARQGGEAEE